ncbi:hypothetical protein Tco_1038972 [Tanacetum coccineum]
MTTNSNGIRSASMGRGLINMGRGSASMGNGFAVFKYGKRVGLASKKDGSANHDRDDGFNTENARIYQHWEDLHWDHFSEYELDRRATMSDLEAVDEALERYNAGLPSVSNLISNIGSQNPNANPTEAI